MLKYKASVENKATYALSKKIALLHYLNIEVTRFEKLKEDYDSCPNFGKLYTSLMSDPSKSLLDYILQDGYFFKGIRLCIIWTSVYDFFV